MISLPGLNLAHVPSSVPESASTSITRTQDLSANTEFRFEVPFTRNLTIKLISGTAEFFGTELGPSARYEFRGTKGAVFTWHGCKLEIGGDSDSEYVAEETTMMQAANAHFALEDLRHRAAQTGDTGPRVLVVGGENVGKTSLVRTLTSYAVKTQRQPVVVNLDPREGMLSVPGSLSAAAFGSILDIEDGWGSSPISGPSPVPVKMPLVYHYGLGNPEEGKIFRPLVTRMALAVTSRLEEDRLSKQSGFIIDTPGPISQGKAGVYENIEHIVSEFSVNVLFVLGSERLYSDLTRKYSSRTEDPVSVIRIDKSGGCVDRDEAYMKALRQAQIRSYFFGNSGEAALNPNSQSADFDDLNIFKVIDVNESEPNGLFRGGDADDDVYGGQKEEIYEKIAPRTDMTNSLLAITTASAKDSKQVIRDSSVKGYFYLADVDETKRKVRLLAPQPGQTPSNALIWGPFPEDVAGLV